MCLKNGTCITRRIGSTVLRIGDRLQIPCIAKQVRALMWDDQSVMSRVPQQQLRMPGRAGRVVPAAQCSLLHTRAALL